MALGPRPVGGDAVGEENAFDRIELAVTPWLEVAREIVLEEPVIEERPVLFGLEPRENDRAEERRILLEQEDVQFVAGMLGVKLLLLGLVELRPAEEKSKRRQIGALRERAVERKHLREAVVGLEPARRHIREFKIFAVGLPRLDDRHFLLLNEVFLRIERRAEPEVGKERGRGGKGDAADERLRRIDDAHRHLLMGRQLLERNPNRAVGIGDEVGKHEAAVDEEIEIGKALRRGSPRHLRRIGRRRHARRRRLGTGELISRLGVLLRRLRVVDRPGMKEEARPIDHCPGKRQLPPAAEDVADLVAEIAAADIRCRVGPLGIGPRLRPADLRKISKQIEIGRHPRGDEMDARERIGGFELDDEIGPLWHDPLKRRWQKPRRLELPEGPHIQVIDALAGRDPDHDPRAAPLQKQFVVAGREIRQDEISILDGEMREAIGRKTAAAEFEQRHLVARGFFSRQTGPGNAPRQIRHAHRLPDSAMNRLPKRDPIGEEGPGVGGAFGALGGDRVDGGGARSREHPKIDRPLLVGLERERRRVAEVARMKRDHDRPRRPRLPRLPADFDDRPVAGADEKQVLDLVGAIDGIDGERLARAELQRLTAGGQPLDLPRQREGDRREPLGDEKLVGPLPVFEELEIEHFLDRRHAVEIDRLDRQLRRLEARKRHRPAVDQERRTEEHLRDGACPQALPVDVDCGAEFVRFAGMLEEVEARDLRHAFLRGNRRRHDDRLAAGGGAQGDEDRAVVAAGILLPLEDEPAFGHLAAGVVEDREPLPRRGADDKGTEPPFPHQRPARPAVADEVDDIHPRLRKLREIDMANGPQERVVVRLHDKLHRRRQAVEGDVGVDLLEVREEVTAGVDLEDPHGQFWNVLHRQIEGHRRVGPKRGRIRGEKLDVDPVAEGPVGRRAEDCRMPLLFAQAASELRLGKQPGEIGPFHQWGKLPRVGCVDEKVGQHRTDKRLVVADRRQERAFERQTELAGEGTGQIGRQELGCYVALRPRQLQILEKRFLVPHPFRHIVHEEVVADVGLERVVNRPEPIRERLQALEVAPLHARVAAPIVVGSRLELVEHRRHEGRMLNELGLEDAERVELGDGEEPMDRQRSEAGGVWRVEIGGDELLEARMIGADKP